MTETSSSFWAAASTTSYVIGIIICLVTVTCIIGDILALHYFLKHRKTTSAVSYIFLASNDIVTLCLLAPLQVSLIVSFSESSSKPVACTTWAVLWCISRRLNNFTVMWVLGCKTISLMSHFKCVKVVNIYGPMLTYTMFLVAQGFVPIVMKGGYTRDVSLGLCDWTFNSLVVSDKPPVKMLLVTLDVLQFGGPIIADIVMITSAVVFIKSGNQVLGKVHISSVSTKARVTVTILMIGSFHVILNVPQLVYLVLFYSQNFYATQGLTIDKTLKVLVILVFPLVNCVSNAMIYFGRMTALRLQACQMLQLLQVYWHIFTDAIKYMCHENNRVVPSSGEQSVFSGAGSGLEAVRQMKCSQLKEIIDAEMASEEKTRYEDYLYQEEEGGEGHLTENK